MNETQTYEEQINDALKQIVIWCGVLTVVLLATIGVATLGFVESFSESSHVNAARIQSKYDACFLLRNIVHTATPPTKQDQARAAAFIARTPLSNCTVYSRKP